jgi:hypothetical protein
MFPCCVDKWIGASEGGDPVGGSAPGGGHGAVEDQRDLRVGESGQIVVGHGLALFGWQRAHRGVQVEIVGIGPLWCGGIGWIGNRDGPP